MVFLWDTNTKFKSLQLATAIEDFCDQKQNLNGSIKAPSLSFNPEVNSLKIYYPVILHIPKYRCRYLRGIPLTCWEHLL